MRPDTDPDWSAVFDALADGERRAVLRRLRRAAGDPIPMEEVEAALAAAGPPDYGGLTLHHAHLPKLADAGLVAVEGDRSAASATPLALALPGWVCDPERRWEPDRLPTATPEPTADAPGDASTDPSVGAAEESGLDGGE
ncbi:hypothetical protein [Halobaculum sp. EA56]|uniref:hypothetical protein n=1 Tax=Halobaculum sp. EA56 TaxID=3421648 RepID=UPI003EB79214